MVAPRHWLFLPPGCPQCQRLPQSQILLHPPRPRQKTYPKTRGITQMRDLQMPLQETRGPAYIDQKGNIQRGKCIFVFQPFTTTDLLNWKYLTPSYMEKPQAMIDLMQSIIQTYQSTWVDRGMQTGDPSSFKMARGMCSGHTRNIQAYAQTHFPNTYPGWTPKRKTSKR